MPQYAESVEYRTTVTPAGFVEVRRDRITLRDGVEFAREPRRHVLAPGDDLTGQDARVVAVAKAAWTPDVLAAYQASTQRAAPAATTDPEE